MSEITKVEIFLSRASLRNCPGCDSNAAAEAIEAAVQNAFDESYSCDVDVSWQSESFDTQTDNVELHEDEDSSLDEMKAHHEAERLLQETVCDAIAEGDWEEEVIGADIFETFQTTFEAVSPSGDAELITVVTPNEDADECIRQITSGECTLEDQVEWWNEWGARRHAAEIAMAEMSHQERFDSDDAPEVDGDFETDTLRLEEFVEENADCFACEVKDEAAPEVGNVGFLYHTSIGSGRYEIASEPQRTRRGVPVMNGYVDDDDCTGARFTAFDVGRVLSVKGRKYTITQLEGEDLKKAIEKLGYDENGDPVPPDVHEVAAHFKSFTTEVEAILPSGITETILVETDVFSDCYDMLDEITDRDGGFSDFDDDIKWWAEWGARRHAAEVSKAKMLHAGRFDAADAPEMEGDFEADTLRLEAFVKELFEPAYTA